MKYSISVLFLCISLTVSFGQTLVPQPIPCQYITSTSVNSIATLIEAYECLNTFGTVIFNTDQDYEIKAGKYISFTEETLINPDNTHSFHAFVEEPTIDVVWFDPNSTVGSVGRYEKLELGVQFQQDIMDEIQNFINESGSPQLNPFNPEDIDLYAEFWYLDGTTRIGPKKINGFYYREFERHTSIDTDPWLDLNTNYNFRIRFAPRELGTWKCKITADAEGHGTISATEFLFQCVDNGSKGFMRVGDNNRYFRIEDEPFFPVGHNLSWPRGPEIHSSAGNTYSFLVNDTRIIYPELYEIYHKQMDTFAMFGANYFRFINAPWATEIEFEKIGNYYDRQIHAWELDRILDHAEELGLRIHFNNQVHYAFESPWTVSTFWDWPKHDDPLSNFPCFTTDDDGYCYRNISSVTGPIDFFTDAEAKAHYKNRLRYIVARWGYSNEIGVFELMSEINNVGNTTLMEYLGPGLGCKKSADQTGYGKAYELYANTVCPLVYAWQNEMCQFIKEELEHDDHPIAVNYTGEPDVDNGDESFFSPYVDIMTWNYYQVLVAKAKKDFDALLTYTNNKPIMHSEYGPGEGNYYLCDEGVQFRKALILSAFTGLAGAAMNWDWQYPGQTHLWEQMGVMRDFMEGIKLDEEEWWVQTPIITDNNEIEVYYLRNFVDDNYRACGVMSNRSYNYYTQGSGLPCTTLSSELQVGDNSIYLNATDFPYTDFEGDIKIPNMGLNKEYKIDWINALTGDYIITTLESTNLFSGNLQLNYPNTLTGDETQPILLFRIYRADESSFKAQIESGGNNQTSDEYKLERDSNYTLIEETTSTRNEKLTTNDIVISPNPTKDKVNISAGEIFFQTNAKWYLTDGSGMLLQEGEIIETNFIIDMTVYDSGNYFLIVEMDKTRYVNKIIKN